MQFCAIKKHNVLIVIVFGSCESYQKLNTIVLRLTITLQLSFTTVIITTCYITHLQVLSIDKVFLNGVDRPKLHR